MLKHGALFLFFKACVNKWSVLHTLDLGEPVVALLWLQTTREWVVPPPIATTVTVTATTTIQ